MQILFAKTHNMRFKMKIIIRIIGTLLAIVKLSAATDLILEDPYLSSNMVGEVKNIAISKLLDFKKIVNLKLANAKEFDGRNTKI